MIDQAKLREALAALFKIKRDVDDEDWDAQEVDPTSLYIVLEAARLVADPDTLTITKVDGEWPESVLRGLLSRKQMLDALMKEQPK